jgi:DNA-binding IclR family transcriptional regulator
MGTVQSIDRAFDLLQALAVQPLLLTELAATADLPVSTVSRLVATLSELQAVERDADGRYRIGEFIATLAGGVDPTASLTTIAQPHLASLADRVGESAGLSIPIGDRVLYVSHADVESDVQIRQWTGTRAPMHVVSAGLAMLASMETVAIDKILNKSLHRSTDVSVINADLIRERLAATRALGYVWTGEEFAEGIASVAAPIFDEHALAGAIHVHGPAYRFPGKADASSLGELVSDAAENLSIALGSI